jgi:proteasome lid subunit RPN8/RPN11
VILIPSLLLERIVDDSEHAYPEECCGLLVGEGDPTGTVTVTRVVSSPNVASSGKGDSFEVDPKLVFDLMRELGGGVHRIVGHYHSHPDHPARPSRRDVEMAWEPEMVWLITSVIGGRAERTTAHLIDRDRGRFREIDIGTPD